LLRSSQAPPGSCTQPESREYDGRRVSFGKSAGPSLDEYVLDFASVDEAGATFDDFKADDQATIDCGDRTFRSNVSLQNTPKGVGTQRYTFVSNPTVGGKKVTVTSTCVVKGEHLVLLVFVAWPKGAPKPAAVATKAIKLLETPR
jgi:hypothetical protein